MCFLDTKDVMDFEDVQKLRFAKFICIIIVGLKVSPLYIPGPNFDIVVKNLP